MNRTTLAALAALSALSLNAGIWQGITDDHHYSGPKISEADLAGKVVMVDQWGINCPPCRALLPAMQKLWNANKSKPFMLIGAHCQGRNPKEVQALVDANKLTYPIYDWAGLANAPSSGGGLPFMYVVDHRGKVVYSGPKATSSLSTKSKSNFGRENSLENPRFRTKRGFFYGIKKGGSR